MQMMRSKRLEAAVTGNNAEATAARKWTLTQNGMKCVEELTAAKTFQWRTINLNTITRVACNGNEWRFE